MIFAIDHPWLMSLLPVTLWPLLGRHAEWRTIDWLEKYPADRPSQAIEASLRLVAAFGLLLLILGLAGLHRRQHEVARLGRGAHIVLALDRSLSMDEAFALAGQHAAESKTSAATRLVQAMFDRRPQDSFAVVAFSTQPILVMPLTPHRAPIAAVLAAMRDPGLANTDIGGGLLLALQQFQHDDPEATRVVLLVSDGAGYIPFSVRERIRQDAVSLRAHLYYLYLRAGDEPPLLGTASGDNTQPAALDAFLRGIGVPYRGFEASDPSSVRNATRLIDALETKPLIWRETIPRQDLSHLCFETASVCLTLVLLAQLAERRVSAV